MCSAKNQPNARPSACLSVAIALATLFGCGDSESDSNDRTDGGNQEHDTAMPTPDTSVPDGQAMLPDSAADGDVTDPDAGSAADAHYERFVTDAVHWITTFEREGETITLGGSQGASTVAIRNGMRNSVSWYRDAPGHELGDTTNLGICMSAYVLKEAYPHLSQSMRSNVVNNLRYLQRALLATQQRSASHPAQHAFPAKPGAAQYSAKTNAICGLALVELYFFWRALAETDESYASYQSDARLAAGDVATFLLRMQNPRTLPGFASGSTGFTLLDEPDRNDDGVYDGIYEEIVNGKLVPATALWSVLAGRYFSKLADLGWTAQSPASLRQRAEGMKLFAAEGLEKAAEHYAPRWQCSSSSCAGQFAETGLSIAKSWNFSGTQGGDGKWHARFAKPGGLFENLNGSDPPQWAFNAIHAIDADFRDGASFARYFSSEAKQAEKTTGAPDFSLLEGESKRDLFLGLGTYILHGRVEQNTRFVLDTGGADFAHYVKKDGVAQIVTSNYGDAALSAWNTEAWRAATVALWRPQAQRDASEAVSLQGKYDFGDLSHLAHWAIEPNQDGALHAKVSDTGRMTVSSENLASTLCRALRAWKGLSACTL